VFDLFHLYFQYAPRHIFPSLIPSRRDPANRFLPSHIFLVMQPNDPSESSFPMKQNDDKLPHDASVFVGRSVDACHRGAQKLMTCPVFRQISTKGSLLVYYWIISPNISKSRISKLFVTRKEASVPSFSARFELYLILDHENINIYAPQNAASAISLIQTLHSSTPKPFLGRILRYEPARAFRTLLISYRCVSRGPCRLLC